MISFDLSFSIYLKDRIILKFKSHFDGSLKLFEKFFKSPRSEAF